MPILQMGTLRFRETWYLVMIMFVQGQSWDSKQAIQDQSLRPLTTAFGGLIPGIKGFRSRKEYVIVFPLVLEDCK